jgi:hypothetical protein
MGVISLILLAFALVCFVIAAVWNPPSPPRVHLGWIGLAFWVGAEILAHAIK